MEARLHQTLTDLNLERSSTLKAQKALFARRSQENDLTIVIQKEKVAHETALELATMEALQSRSHILALEKSLATAKLTEVARETAFKSKLAALIQKCSAAWTRARRLASYLCEMRNHSIALALDLEEAKNNFHNAQKLVATYARSLRAKTACIRDLKATIEKMTNIHRESEQHYTRKSASAKSALASSIKRSIAAQNRSKILERSLRAVTLCVRQQTIDQSAMNDLAKKLCSETARSQKLESELATATVNFEWAKFQVLKLESSLESEKQRYNQCRDRAEGVLRLLNHEIKKNQCNTTSLMESELLHNEVVTHSNIQENKLTDTHSTILQLEEELKIRMNITINLLRLIPDDVFENTSMNYQNSEFPGTFCNASLIFGNLDFDTMPPSRATNGRYKLSRILHKEGLGEYCKYFCLIEVSQFMMLRSRDLSRAVPGLKNGIKGIMLKVIKKLRKNWNSNASG
ncbi:hypothetical protein HK096_009421, partial [Nowakowskiella sp. JEL0078]